MEDVREGGGPERSWEQVATGFAELGGLLDSSLADDKEAGGSAREELRRSWGGFVSAAQGLGQALAATARDPEVRKGAKEAFGSLVDAVESTVRSAAARARPGQSADGGEADAQAGGGDGRGG